MKPPVALTIAGSDSGGGAGIQADLKTFAALGVHGAAAVTAVTAQDTSRVTAVLEMPPELVREQIQVVVDDLRPAAAKTGMLSSVEIIEAVAEAVARNGIRPLVVDPVMVAKGGAKLLRDDAVEALRSRLLPLAAVVTPNIPEAEVLLGREIRTLDDRRRAAAEIRRMGPRAVVVKGGHADGDQSVDVLDAEGTVVELASPRVATANTHGSGCAFSAAVAAHLALGADIPTAVRAAKEFIQGAIEHSLEIGRGHGPVNPMWRSLPPGAAHGPADPARGRPA